MKKTILALLLGLCALSSYAWNNLDRDVIVLDATYINKNATLKQKAVTIFEKSYIVYVSNVKLSPTWFTADISIVPSSGNSDDMELTNFVVQSCDIEDQNPDVHGYKSECDVTLYQNYDFMIRSKVHLLRPADYGKVTVTYTLYDDGKNNSFELDLVFPYFPTTITGIDSIELGEPTAVEYYDLQGRKLDGPRSGIVIEKQGNKVTKKMYR